MLNDRAAKHPLAPPFIQRWLRPLRQRLIRSIVESAQDAEPKMFFFGLFGVVGFPLYYWIWTSLYPQPYESVALRLIGVAIALPALFIRRWPRAARPYIPAYWYAASVFFGPFFFTFMLLQNDVNTVWSGSLVASILLAILLFDLLNALVILALGGALALSLYMIASPLPVPWDALFEQAPVYAFTIVVMGVFNLEISRERRAKIAAATALGSHIAHELRTPLATIRAASSVISDYLPELLETHGGSGEAGQAPRIPAEDKKLLSQAPGTLMREVDHAFMVIDLTLANTGIRPFGDSELKSIDIGEAVASAIARYPFKNPLQRTWLEVDTADRFEVLAVPVLLDHIVFNLLKNSIYAIRAAGREAEGRIQLRTISDPSGNRLIVTDNGQGIPPAIVSRVFSAFFSTRPNGTGLGLHYCRTVMLHFGGEIHCRSEPGRFTEMTLEFPPTSALRPDTA